MDAAVVEALRVKFGHLHPLIFRRSLEKSTTVSELFDILDTIPSEYPLVWCDHKHRWVTTKDIHQEKSRKL